MSAVESILAALLYGLGATGVAIGATGLARTMIFDIRNVLSTGSPTISGAVLGVGVAALFLARALEGFIACPVSP